MAAVKCMQRLTSSFNRTLNFRQFNSIAAAKRDDSTRMLHVEWDNGRVSRYPYVWLRDNCPAPHTYNITDQCKSRKLLFKDLDVKVVPDKVESSSEGVKIVWPGANDSFYSTKWLADRNIDNPEVKRHRHGYYMESEKKQWDAGTIGKVFRSFDWSKMFSDDRTMLDALTFLNTWGLLLVDGMPCKQGEVLKLASELGYFKPTNYGETFEVRAEPVPSNLAYTSFELGLHTDLPYFDDMPEIQALHCIQSAGVGKGGENQFVDVFNVSEQIKKVNPDHYRILSTVNLEYVDDIIDQGRSFQQAARHPVFNFDRDGNFKFGAWNNQVRSWYYPVGPEKLHDVYSAMATFREYYSKPENVFELRLSDGQMIVFDNLRVMHARTAYEVNENTQRHLQGIYYTWDSVRSKIRSLRRKLNTGPQHVTI